MADAKKQKRKIEYGDFQTPVELARKACRLLSTLGISPKSVVEPTCGTGNFVIAAVEEFRDTQKILGFDINPEYVKNTRYALERLHCDIDVGVSVVDFFNTDWANILGSLPEPILVIGNPPWVTNTELSTLKSSNLPEKNNSRGISGLGAITGKSNFDVSEWMLNRIFDSLSNRKATVAMLCKTSVARKALKHLWDNGIKTTSSRIFLIDAAKYFGISADACFLVCMLNHTSNAQNCSVYNNIEEPNPVTTIGYENNQLIADIRRYDRWKHLQGDHNFKWRSGIKHDCSKVMELTKNGKRYRNGFGELIEIENEYLYPMLKSSDIANGFTRNPKRWMLVTQKTVGDDTNTIEHIAPKTWAYLQTHAEYLDRRASSIYRKKPRFSIFGVGPYTWSLWKVAISGFYKKLDFRVIGNIDGKPIVLDDTSYFLPCDSEVEANNVATLLNSSEAKEFYESFVFWDDKRPIKSELLERLDLVALAHEIGVASTLIERVVRCEDQLGLYA
jgi:hypothetical protein